VISHPSFIASLFPLYGTSTILSYFDWHGEQDVRFQNTARDTSYRLKPNLQPENPSSVPAINCRKEGR